MHTFLKIKDFNSVFASGKRQKKLGFISVHQISVLSSPKNSLSNPTQDLKSELARDPQQEPSQNVESVLSSPDTVPQSLNFMTKTRFAFVASKKAVSKKAVTRNRAKRRLRAALAVCMSKLGDFASVSHTPNLINSTETEISICFLANRQTPVMPFEALCGEVLSVLKVVFKVTGGELKI